MSRLFTLPWIHAVPGIIRTGDRARLLGRKSKVLAAKLY